jgi:hypothetical protein
MGHRAAAAILAPIVLIAVLGCGAGAGTSGGHGILFVRQGHAAAANWEPNGPLFLWQAGAPLRQLTKTQAADRPQWSPDGRKIVYVAAALVGNGKWNGEGPCQSFGCDYEIWVMRAGGGGRREVTRDVGNASDVASANSPSWAPSGRQIVYSRSYYNQFDDTLAVVSPDSGQERALKVDGQYPVWGAGGIAYLSYGPESGSSIRGQARRSRSRRRPRAPSRARGRRTGGSPPSSGRVSRSIRVPAGSSGASPRRTGARRSVPSPGRRAASVSWSPRDASPGRAGATTTSTRWTRRGSTGNFSRSIRRSAPRAGASRAGVRPRRPGRQPTSVATRRSE